MSRFLVRHLRPACSRLKLPLRERPVQLSAAHFLSTRGRAKEEHHQTLDFSNAKEAFQSVSSRELWRHYLVFKAFSYEWLVDQSQEIIFWTRKMLGRRLFSRLMKTTVYGQFVAGEDVDSILPNIAKLKDNGVRPILDYATEEDIPDSKEASRVSARTYVYKGEEKCDQMMKHFLSCINTTADVSDDGFAAIKLTGLGRVEFLRRLSEVLVGTQQLFEALSNYSSERGLLEARITEESFHRGLANMEVEMKQSEVSRLFHEIDTDKSGCLNVFEWSNHFQPGKELHKIFSTKKGSKVQPLLGLLDKDEVEQMNSVVRRARTLAECAQDRGVRLMIDAEQTYFQPAIRHVAVNVLMPEFNLSASRPVVYNTVQCYLRGAKTVLEMDLELSRLSGFCYGVKLVRGAYMEQENKLAMTKGYTSPIWPDKKGTDDNYHSLLEWLLEQVHCGKLHLMVASHNESTVRLAIQM